MPQMKFLSIRELQQQGSGIKNMLIDDGKIIITSNGKPIGLTVGVDEASFEEILSDWNETRQQRHLRYIDKNLDESEIIAANKNTEWIDEDDFWNDSAAYL